MAKSSLAVALLLALGASGAVAQGFQESTVTPLNDTTTACDWCKINANLVPGEPKDLPAASYMYERASMTASSNEAANATILMTQKSAVQAGPVGQSGSYLVDRLLAEREGRLVYWVNALNNGWSYSGLRITAEPADAEVAVLLKMNALQLQGQTNDSVFQGVPGRLLVLYKFDEVLKNIVGEPILSAVNLENKENRGLWEYTYNLTNGEYLFAAYPNTSRIPEILGKATYLPGDNIYRTIGFWQQNQIPANEMEKFSVGMKAEIPTQLVVDKIVATLVANSTYTVHKNESWQIMANPALDAKQAHANFMYSYDSNDTALFPIDQLNFAFYNGTNWQPLPSYYDGDYLFTNASGLLGNGWLSLAITNQVGSNFSAPLIVTTATATASSATETFTRTASKTTRPDAIPDATTTTSGASAVVGASGIVVAFIMAVAALLL